MQEPMLHRIAPAVLLAARRFRSSRFLRVLAVRPQPCVRYNFLGLAGLRAGDFAYRVAVVVGWLMVVDVDVVGVGLGTAVTILLEIFVIHLLTR